MYKKELKELLLKANDDCSNLDDRIKSDFDIFPSLFSEFSVKNVPFNRLVWLFMKDPHLGF